MGGEALVEEVAAEQFNVSELSGGELGVGNLLIALAHADGNLARHIDIDAVFLLFLFLPLHGFPGGHRLQVFYINIIRCTGEVVGIHHAQLL